MEIKKVVLYKHGVGYFERRGEIEGDGSVTLHFKAREMNDVLKSMTALDLGGGAVSAISYDSTKPVEKLLEDLAIRIPEEGSLISLLGQLKGAAVEARVGDRTLRGAVIGADEREVAAGETSIQAVYLSLRLEDGAIVAFDVMDVGSIRLLDEDLSKDLGFYLDTVISGAKKEQKRLTVFYRGAGRREIFLAYVIETPVWKTTYRMLLDEGKKTLLQGWAVVDNPSDEDWSEVALSLVAGLPISFIHDLYEPRYKRRPVVRVREEEAAAPVIMAESRAPSPKKASRRRAAKGDMDDFAMGAEPECEEAPEGLMPPEPPMAAAPGRGAFEDSTKVETLTKDIGDLFEYTIARPVTVLRNRSALVPIVQDDVEAEVVLLYNDDLRKGNPFTCLELKNTTDLTLEGGPLTVIDSGTYVGEAMIDTMKPEEKRIVPYAIELGMKVNVSRKSWTDSVRRVQIIRGVMYMYYFDVRQRIYEYASRARGERTLIVEHPIESGWDLENPEQAGEKTDSHYRYRLAVAPGEAGELKVRERRETYSTYYLSNIDADTIQIYLSRRFIDKRIAAVLEKAAGIKVRRAELERKLAELKEERKEIYEDQKRLKENIKALGAGAEEKSLRSRYVKKLGQQEDRLEKIEAEIQSLEEMVEELRAELDRVLGEVEFETELEDRPTSGTSAPEN